MLICTECRIILKCIKNSIGVDFGNGHLYAGDLFRCPECGYSVVSTNKNASYDPEYKYFDHYLPMVSDQIKGISQKHINNYLECHFKPKDQIVLKK